MPIEAKNVYFRYNKTASVSGALRERLPFSGKGQHSRNGQPWVLEDKSLILHRGERLALSAPSGYGKTTLAMLLAGYLKPVKGEILLDGKPLPGKGVCPVQLIYQHPEKAINPRWRLKKVLEESGEIKEEMLDALGIERAWLGRFPAELSGGELQRFCVARALSCGAEYLICDEISTMLDAVTQAQIWNVVLEEAEKRGMGLLAVTHNRHLAERVAERVVELADEE